MKTIILTISLLMASYFAFSQSLTWLNVYESERKISYPSIVDETEKEVVLFTYDKTKSKKLGTFWGDDETPMLMTINKGSKAVERTVSYIAPFQGEELGEEVSSLMWGSFNLSGTQVGMVKKVTGKKKKNQTSEIWLMEMLKNGNWGKKKKIWDGEKHTKSPYKIVSPDRSLVVLGAFENSVFNFVIADGELSDFVTNKIHFDITYEWAESLGVTNQGDLVFVFHTKSGMELRKYDIFTKKYDKVQLVGSLGDNESYETKYVLKDGEILYSATLRGTYVGNKDRTYYTGIKKLLTFKVDLGAMKVTSKAEVNLNDEALLKKFYKAKKVEKGKVTEMSDSYSLINIDESEKNIYTLIEYRNDYSTTSCDENGRCTTTYHYERNSLLLVILSKTTGDVKRIRIPKYQHQKNTSTYGGSYAFADNKGYNILYRDTPKNLLIGELSEPKSSNKPKKEPLTVVRYGDHSKTLKKNILAEPKGLVSIPKAEYSENGKVWFYCSGHGSFTFGEYKPQ